MPVAIVGMSGRFPGADDLDAFWSNLRDGVDSTGVPLPDNYPVVGKDAFRTGTGVHASAILKARARGDDWLVDLVYSAIPASLIGCKQLIEIGPLSGESNVRYWLEERGIPADPELVRALFERGKASSRTLSEDEVLELCRTRGVAVPV